MPAPLSYSEVCRRLRRHRFSFMTRTSPSRLCVQDTWFGGNDGGLDSFVFVVGPADNILHTYMPYASMYKHREGVFNHHTFDWYMENFTQYDYDESHIPLVNYMELYPIELNGAYVNDHETIVSGMPYRNSVYEASLTESKQISKSAVSAPKEASFLRKFNNLDMEPVR